MREDSEVPLSGLTTLRLGGPARRVLTMSDTDELVAAVRHLDAQSDPVLVLGGGSNLVVSDDGFDGTVLRVAPRGISRRPSGLDGAHDVTAAAGESWDGFVAHCVAQGLVGVEALSGIPGLVGATPVQNVGAYGQDVAQTITEVRVLDRSSGEVSTLSAAECGFSYRHSVFKGNARWLVLAVTFRLQGAPLGAPVRYAELARALGVELGGAAPAAEVRAAVLRLRGRKGMVLDDADPDTWSAGSFFTNPVLPSARAAGLPEGAPRWPDGEGGVKTSAAWLIEAAGFAKGYGTERAGLSTKHTLALTNRGGASTEEVLEVARRVRAGVLERFGVELVNEPVLLNCTL